MLNEIIAAYHDLLSPTMAAESQGQMDRHQKQHGLFFGDRAMCTVLRPRFFTPHQYHFLRQRVAVLLSALGKAHAAALADAGFRSQFCLTPEEEELVQDDPGFPCHYPTSRLDAFYVSEQELKFTEYNSETPAGAAYNYALSAMFLGLSVFREFMRKHQVFALQTHVGVHHVLLDAFQTFAGKRTLPRIAILDWKEVPTYSEFILFRNYFQSQGLDVVIADPREVEYRGERLWSEGKPIDLIYKRVLISELLQRGGMEHPVVRAVRCGHVCMVNPFRCKILYKKASFAFLTDERNAQLFTTDELKAIADHIPWTRVAAERHTLPPIGFALGTVPVDLIPFVLRNQQRLVLKPNDEYGGKGIVLGWTVDASEWEHAVATALKEPYIVQERVNLPKEPFPSWIDGRLHVIDRMLDTDPFCCYGQYMDGGLCRISTSDLLNVTAGGGSTVPSFIVEKR